MTTHAFPSHFNQCHGDGVNRSRNTLPCLTATSLYLCICQPCSSCFYGVCNTSDIRHSTVLLIVSEYVSLTFIILWSLLMRWLRSISLFNYPQRTSEYVLCCANGYCSSRFPPTALPRPCQSKFTTYITAAYFIIYVSYESHTSSFFPFDICNSYTVDQQVYFSPIPLPRTSINIVSIAAQRTLTLVILLSESNLIISPQDPAPLWLESR